MNGRDEDNGTAAAATDADRPHDPEEWDDPVPDVVEPGRPSPENVAFVLLGVLAALYVLARVAGLV